VEQPITNQQFSQIADTSNISIHHNPTNEASYPMPPEIAELVKAMSSIVTACAACFGAYIAYKGLTKWQIENIGKKKVDLAEELLASIYDARDRVSQVRSPLGYLGEGQTREQAKDETPEQKHALDTAFSTLERYNMHREFFATLNAKRYRAKALFGDALEEQFRELFSAINEVLFAAHDRMDDVRHRATDLDEVNRLRRIVMGTGSAKDEIAVRIETAVRRTEGILRPIIEKGGT
jgi:hypothetical protein